MTAEQDEQIRQQRVEATRLTGRGLIGVAIAGLASLSASLQDGVVGQFGIGSLIVLAAFAVGGALGFLFAVPRVLSEGGSLMGANGSNDTAKPAGSSSLVSTGTAPAPHPTRLGARLLGSNTNLERISDWLTTMLVGVGLSQIGNIGKGLEEFSTFLRASCPSAAPTVATCGQVLPTIGPFLLIFGTVAGFLFFYLYTRLVIVTQLNDVERFIDGSAELANAKIDDNAARTATVAAATSLQRDSENPTFRAIAASKQPSVQESFSVMNALLYKEGGYQEVIELGGKLANSPAAKLATFWVLMAAAFGQKHHQLQQKDGAEGDLRSAYDNTIDCVRRAMQIDPEVRDWLWRLTDPNGMDNDLQDFRSDPVFLALIGRS